MCICSNTNFHAKAPFNNILRIANITTADSVSQKDILKKLFSYLNIETDPVIASSPLNKLTINR